MLHPHTYPPHTPAVHTCCRSYLTEYFILGFVSIGCNLARAVLTITGSITASRLLNHRLLAKVVRLPMSFFDSQPTGK